MSAFRFPLNPEARISVALQILKTALLPFTTDQLRAQGLDPVTLLPPSSAVVKHGFELDVRDALRMISAKPDAFSRLSASADLRPHIRQISRLRDLWAHQQALSEAEASRFCKIGSQFLKVLGRHGEGAALKALASEPPDCFLPLVSRLQDRTQRFEIILSQDLMTELDLDPDDHDDALKLQKALVWSAAADFVCNRPALALLVCDEPDIGPRDGRRHLPAPALCWLLGLAHDAPLAAIVSAYDDWLFQLDPHAGWT